MNKQSTRAIFVSLIMILSSLAGCIGDEEIQAIEEATDALIDGNNTTTIGNLGSVMVSTYHIGELVKGIAGEHVDMEYMSLDNIPVHDYEPSASDLIRLQNADVFFYHGLGLEPWVDDTLDALGSDAPTSIQVHTMPDGEETLDYESLLISNLCETLSEGPYEVVELVDEEEHADDVEIHAEFVAHNITFPHDEHADEEDDHADEEGEHADEEGEHADEEGDHDEHSEEGHDDHAGHEGHNHAEAEETISNPAGCPADTMISIFHLEEGEYVIEFDAEHPEDFSMAVLKMLGGHAHHDHGDEHGDEHGVCHDMDDHTNNDIENEADCEAAGFMWMEEDEHEGDYCHDTANHSNTNHTTEEECEAAGHMWMEEDGHGDHEDHLTPEEALEAFDTNNDSHLSWNEFFESWNEEHEEHEEHDEHDNHDEEHHNVAVLYPDNSLEMFEAEHDALPENATGWNLTTSALMDEGNLTLNFSVHPTYGTNLLGINGTDAPDDYSWYWQLMLWNESTNDSAWEVSNFGIDSVMIPEMTEHIAWMANSSNMSLLPNPTMMEDDHDDEHDDHDDDHDEHGDEHEDHGDEPTEMELMEAFNASDVDGDQMLNITELGEFIEMIEHLEGGEEHHAGYLTIHVAAEGDYGFALPMDVEFHILMGEDGHDDHADEEGDHADEEGDHADEEGDHADEEGDHGDEEGDDHDDHAGEEGNPDYDPHSWLSPLAFKAQVNVVMDALTTAFPAGEEVFKANAEIYSTQLTALHFAFETAFGEGGVCMTGGHQKTVAANHIAYSYIAEEYGIQFMTVHGLDPEGEPSPEDIAKVVNFINEEGITVLFVEEYTDQSAVQSIVDETGVSIQILYTMEMAPSNSDDTYMTMMTKNLANLASGIGCE